MMFVFGVLTYCQEKIILETLESIKYQIQNFGQEYSFHLVIIDDASTDSTFQICKDWAEENKKLFSKIDIIKNEVNKGTVLNYCFFMNQYSEEQFKVIAGDDVFSSSNLFAAYDGIGKDEVRCYMPLYLANDRIYYTKRCFINNLFFSKKRLSNNYFIRQIRKGSSINTPSTIYGKELYQKSKTLNFLSNFKLYEDDPTWYSIAKNVKDSKFCFSMKNIVLYRIHICSVSQINNKNTVFENDLQKLREIYIEDTKGAERIYLKSKNSSCNKWIRIDRYIDLLVKLYRTFVVMINPKYEYKKAKAELDRLVIREQKYYDSISCVNKYGG